MRRNRRLGCPRFGVRGSLVYAGKGRGRIAACAVRRFRLAAVDCVANHSIVPYSRIPADYA